MNFRYILTAVIVVVALSLLIYTDILQTNDSNHSLNWNYHEITLFNHDLHSYSFTYSGDERDDNGNFSMMIRSINRNFPDVLFNINGGDLRSDSSELNSFKNDYLDGGVVGFNRPVMFVIGNHELVNSPSGSVYRSIFGSPSYYNFSENNSYFMVIDNADSQDLNSTQLSWLNEQLNKSQKYKYRFVFMHVPLYKVNNDTETSMNPDGVGGADYLRNLFDSNNVTMIFASHVHNYYNGTWGKTPFIISGGAGAPPEENHPPFHHYIFVNVTDNSFNYFVVPY